MIYIVQHRRGTTEQWQQSDIIPDDGEMVLEQCGDNVTKVKVGNGQNKFADLPYLTSTDAEGVDGLLYEDNLLYLTANGVIVSDPIEIKAGADEGMDERVTELEKNMADLLYKAISVTSFSHNAGTLEIGSTLDTVTLSWSLNKAPKSLTLSPLNGEELTVSQSGSITLNELGLTSATTWTLTATDERDTVAKKTTTVNFYNGVYYGASAEPEVYDSSFILGLTRELRSNKKTSINVTAGEGQYIYYCLPTRSPYGECSFTLGGFNGGFELVATIDFMNDSDYEEPYYIYRSSYAALGNPTITIA